MKLLNPTLAVIAASTIALTASAKPAKPGVRTVFQPDGTELQVVVSGDEFTHFITTPDGILLHVDADGLYTYGVPADNGAIVSTGVSATAPSTAVRTVNINSIDIPALESKRFAAVRKSRRQSAPASRAAGAPQTGLGLVSSTYPRTGSPKGLIILVQYSDVKFRLSDPLGYFEDMINGENFTQYDGTGSALRYFTDQSQGQFKPSFDIYGPVTLPNKMSYYGGNDAWGEDQRAEYMVVDAVKALDDTVDFSKYDTDGDGEVDNVYIFYAGQGEADYGSSNTVWPHSWDLTSARISLYADNVRINHYACSNEWGRNAPDGVGTFVHEFSHVIGLPDLYRTDGTAAYYTPGEYSVMDAGPYNNEGRTPPNYGAYERNAMGWSLPDILDGTPRTVTLDNVTTGQFALIPTQTVTEFFLLENRQLEGWDKYIPNHGMLIWHIDYNRSVFENNTVNNTRNHQYVDIVEANNDSDGSTLATLRGWTYPGTSGNTAFTSTTRPALKDWAGRAIDVPVTGITEKNGLITFDVSGGVGQLAAPSPEATVANDTDRHFIASWQPVDGATDYYLTVYAVDGGLAGNIENGFDGSALPAGWDKDMTLAWYTTATNYGQASPSLKLSKTGQWIASPELPGNVTRIEFWSKGQSVGDSGTTLTIEGWTGGAWTLIENYLPANNKTDNVVIDAGIPEGVRKVRFTINKVSGNIALDDIVITYGGTAELLQDYNEMSTGGQTEVKVDKLRDGVADYVFTVQATDGTARSAASKPVSVHVGGMTNGVDNITVDSDTAVEYYNLQGVRIDRPAPGTVVIVRRGNTTAKHLIR